MDMRYHSNAIKIVAIFFIASCLICCTAKRKKITQLEEVAKDWSLVIRASQVIPVYPLTEDLQPGDVMLVTVPVEDQVKIYKEKGFLPLDQHLVRLKCDYSLMYGKCIGIPGETISRKIADWDTLPGAAFPSYNFSVDSEAGFNLALPVQGVSAALGIMNTNKATGNVVIKDAYSYGIDIVTLHKEVHDWAKTDTIRRLLQNYEPYGDKYHYLRVINRIYLAKKINVNITNEEQAGAGVDYGTLQKVDSIAAVRKDSLMALPEFKGKGARLRIYSASSRSVSMSEVFDKPLVIGYIGFDLPILKFGKLGAPISTLGLLSKYTMKDPDEEVDYRFKSSFLTHMYSQLGKDRLKSEYARSLYENLDKSADCLPKVYSFSVYRYKDTDGKFQEYPSGMKGKQTRDKKDFNDVIFYYDYVNTTVEHTIKYLENNKHGKEIEELKKNLEIAIEARDHFTDCMKEDPAIREASLYVIGM